MVLVKSATYYLLGSFLIALISLSCLSLTLIKPTTVLAQTNPEKSPIHLTISPSVVELAIQPGKTITQAFLVKNEGTVDLEVTPQMRDFEAGDLYGVPQLLPSSSFPYADLANSEIHLNEPFTLMAGQSEQFVLHINVPESASEQDWYFSLLANSKPDLSNLVVSQESAATTQGTIGANVLVRITRDNLTPLHWTIDLPLPRFIDSLQKIEYVPVVTNNSRTYAIPDLTITTLNWQHNIISEEKGLPERVLAQSQRRIHAQQARKDDPRSLEGVSFRLAPKFALGPYTIRASIANNTGEPYVVEHQVIALPFSILAAIIGVTFVLSLLRIYRLRPEKE